MTVWISGKRIRIDFPNQGNNSGWCPGWLGLMLLACFGSVVLSPSIRAQDKNSSQLPPPLAVYAGEPIYENQLPTNEQQQLQRMAQQVFAVKRRALQSVLNQKLVEAEAKRKGVSAEDLMKSEVDSKIAEPTEDEVSAYYKARQDQIKQPFDDVKDKIRQGLKDKEIQKARVAYIQGLMQRAVDDRELLVMLGPPKIEMGVDPARLRGDPKAPVTIVEFSDFSCAYCGKAESTITQLLAKYPGQVKLGYRDFPLRQLHPQAELAAEASRCAGEQGKYWEYHDVLFANSGKQGDDDLIRYARTLKLDQKAFDGCLSSGRFKAQVDQDIQLGTSAGVVGTPGFFVNGTFLRGAQPADVFEKIIDEELSASSQKHTAN
jgi:protein-disulfide isomerase